MRTSLATHALLALAVLALPAATVGATHAATTTACSTPVPVVPVSCAQAILQSSVACGHVGADWVCTVDYTLILTVAGPGCGWGYSEPTGEILLCPDLPTRDRVSGSVSYVVPVGGLTVDEPFTACASYGARHLQRCSDATHTETLPGP